MLVSCDNGSDLLHINDAFKKPIFNPAKGIDKDIQNSTSHMAKNATGSALDSMDAEPLNPKNLFGKSLGSDSERLSRLERAVQDMRNDFNMVQPSIRRLMAIEGDIQRLVTELEKLNSDVPAAAPKSRSTSTKAPKKTAQKKSFATKTPPPVSGKASVYDLRIGEHPGKTRIVIDTNSKTSFSADIDNNEKIMVIELPNASWDTKMTKTLGKSPYISSYNVESSGDGHIAIFQLKKNASITYKKDLKGFQGNSRRIVIDVSGS